MVPVSSPNSSPILKHLTSHGIYLHHPTEAGSLASLLSSKAPPSHTYELIPLDLSLRSYIRTFCSTLNSRIAAKELGKIKILMLIAGGIFTSKTSDDGVDYTSEGIEKAFAVNYLANFMLCTLLEGSLEKEARIVFLSSTTHDPSFGSNGKHCRVEGFWIELTRYVKHLRFGSPSIT